MEAPRVLGGLRRLAIGPVEALVRLAACRLAVLDGPAFGQRAPRPSLRGDGAAAAAAAAREAPLQRTDDACERGSPIGGTGALGRGRCLNVLWCANVHAKLGQDAVVAFVGLRFEERRAVDIVEVGPLVRAGALHHRRPPRVFGVHRRVRLVGKVKDGKPLAHLGGVEHARRLGHVVDG